MPIEIRPVLPTELDVLERCCVVSNEAFADSSYTGSVVFTGPFPPDADAVRARAEADAIRQDGFQIFAAFDTDLEGLDALVGWAKWRVYEDPAPAPAPRTWGPGVNLEAAELMFGAIDGVRARNMTGKKCIFLCVLVVHPGCQGKGIGKKLMSWGFQEAARLGLPIWLEASPAGKPLYEKSGFKVIDTNEASFEKFGLDKPFVVWGMQWDLPNRRCP